MNTVCNNEKNEKIADFIMKGFLVYFVVKNDYKKIEKPVQCDYCSDEMHRGNAYNRWNSNITCWFFFFKIKSFLKRCHLNNPKAF